MLHCLVLPVGVGAQDGDAQDKVHHDRGEDHPQAQQDGAVLAGLQSRHCLLLVQYVYVAELLVHGPDDRKVESQSQSISFIAIVCLFFLQGTRNVIL